LLLVPFVIGPVAWSGRRGWRAAAVALVVAARLRPSSSPWVAECRARRHADDRDGFVVDCDRRRTADPRMRVTTSDRGSSHASDDLRVTTTSATGRRPSVETG
jgi:hypothetical protein